MKLVLQIMECITIWQYVAHVASVSLDVDLRTDSFYRQTRNSLNQGMVGVLRVIEACKPLTVGDAYQISRITY